MADSKVESRNEDYTADQPREKPILERKRQWEHGEDGREGCQRRAKPIFTDPNEIPGPCGRNNPYSYGCGGRDWNSKGLVYRNKATKEVVGPVREQ